jgi:hypothetical protein
MSLGFCRLPRGQGPAWSFLSSRASQSTFSSESTLIIQLLIEWAQAMIDAFIQAGLWALCSIAVLLWIVLRRAWDVMLTLLPLLVAAAATLEICALLHFPINYANIIALPVLLGVGVAFKIYYVLAWRQGETNFLQSPLTRRRRRLQDLLCAGVATRRDEFPAIAAYSRGFFQRTHDGDRVRQPMAFEPPRFVEHG